MLDQSIVSRLGGRCLGVGCVTLALLVMSACGGGGSSGGDGRTGQSVGRLIDGRVTDPGIEGAAVRIVDEQDQTLTRIVRTDAQGRFSLSVNPAVDTSGLRVVATGGVDSETGLDFTGLSLTAPVVPGEKIIVSPLSTLASASVGGATGLAQRLGVSAPALRGDPAEDPNIQRLSLVAGELLRALRPTDDPAARVATAIRSANGDLTQAAESLSSEGTLTQAVLDQLDAVADRARRLDSLGESPSSASAVVADFSQAHIEAGLERFYSEQLGAPPTSNTEQRNLATLAEAVWQGIGRRGVPADGVAILNLARYLLNSYGFDAQALGESNFSVPAAVGSDSLLPRLASSRALDRTVPLASGETLGSDNAARVEYFFRSDVSPYFRIRQLVSGVVDDSVVDPVYTSVATGLAAAGLTERADTVLRTQIFQPTARGQAFRKAGAELFRNGRLQQASDYWDEAERIYDQHLQDKGSQNLTSEDANFYRFLSANYLEAGFDAEADEALAPLLAFVDQFGKPNVDWTSSYNSLITAVRKQAVAAVEAAEAAGLNGAEYDKAVEQVDLLSQWAYPGPNVGFNPAGVFCLRLAQERARTADLYARLERGQDASQAIDRLEELLNGDCLNASPFLSVPKQTLPAAVSAYGLTGRVNELRSEYPDVAAEVSLDLAVFDAVKAAEQQDAQAAIQIMTNQVDNVHDRVQCMVFGCEPSPADSWPTTTSVERLQNAEANGLAAQLSDAGMPNAAAAITDEAWRLVQQEPTAFVSGTKEASPGEVLENGCLAVAARTALLGDRATAGQRMGACWSLAENEAYSGWVTGERAEGARMVAEALVEVDADASPRLADLRQQAMMLDAANRGEYLRSLALLRARGGEIQGALADLDDLAVPALQTFASGVSDEEGRENAVDEAINTVDAYLDTADEARRNLLEPGALAGFSPARVESARDTAVALLTGESAPEGFTGAVPLISQLTDSTAREIDRKDAVEWLVRARNVDRAETVAAASGITTPERNELIQAIAQQVAEQDDYPGSAVVRFDFDGDGKPDFFSPQSAQAERSAAPLGLDADIDGDGTGADRDLTPYCSDCP